MTDNGIMKRFISGIIFFTAGILLFSEEYVSTLLYSQVLFEDRGTNPVVVTDDRGWVDIGKADLGDFFRVPVSDSESIRKWRVVVKYLDENRTGQTTLQIRLRGEGYTTLFTLPWNNISSVPSEQESNWYMADRMNPQNFLSVCSARLITPPGTVEPGKIYKITLEAWDFTKAEERKTYSYNDTLLASSRLLSPLGQQQTHEIGQEPLKGDDPYSSVKAEEFALEFVEASLYGDLPSFYRALDNEIHTLSDGQRHSKFIINPPEGVNSAWSMEDYKRDYEYRIYSYEEYAALFPEWFADDRSWTPDRRCFLFMGNKVKEGSFPFFSQEDLLVFMVRRQESGWKVIARPQI